VAIDPRDQRIAELEAQVAARDRIIEQLMAKVEMLTARVADLEARLNQNSGNSSKPPSSDPPGTPRPAKVPTGRRPGGQPGHKGHKRELVPPERVDQFVDIPAPRHCGKCERALAGRGVEPLRHQLVEVPPIRPHITEFRCQGRECGGCGAVTYGELPPEVARHTFGERLTGIIVLLSGKYRLSKRKLQDALTDLLGVSISLGTISNREAEVAEALAAPAAEAEEFVRDADAVNADETGWFEGKENGRAKRAWLWVFATKLVVVFRISKSRGGEVPKAVLGEDFTGFLTTDRWNGYNWYDLALRQLCWSHLTRDFQSFVDRGGEGGRIGALLMKERDRMFKWWHRVRDGTMPRAEFERRMGKVERRIGRLLREAVVRAEDKTAGMANEILKLETAMWTFVQVEGLEPTNNFGEQTIRPAVMYRKTSFGTQSPEGSRFVERILTAVMTLRLQERNVLEYLTATIGAHRRGRPAPSLLPITQHGQYALAA
jgi:transposase